MTRVYGKVKIHGIGGSVEVKALFDTGAGKSYLSDRLGSRIGYEKYSEPKEVALAVENATAKVIGFVSAADIEVEGYPLPEKETIGVIEGLREEAIIGLNLIEAYNIVLDTKEGKVGMKEFPPKAFLF